MKELARRTGGWTAAVLCLWVGAGIPMSATADVTSMFEDLGSYGNVTGPGAYEGQTRNYYTGGSIYLRTPNKNYQLYTVQAPGFRAGCGGIDMWAGSFSYINSEQLTAMLKNIGSSALGYAFELAIKSLSPLVADVMETMKNWAQKANQMNVNSCAEGRKLVDGVMKTWKEGMSETAAVGGAGGAAPDYAASRARAADAGFVSSVLTSYLADPTLKEQVADGNVTWRALKKIEGITNEEREILMNMVGTVVFDRANDRVHTIMPAGISVATFVGRGNDENITLNKFHICSAVPASSSRTYDWTGDMSCMTPVEIPRYTMPWSFSRVVRQKLISLRDKIMAKGGITADDIAFVGQTSYPVYRMLSISAATPGLSDTIIYGYEEIIATEYAAAYIIYLTDMLRDGLSHQRQLTEKIQKEELTKLLTNISRLRDEVHQQRVEAYKKAQNISLVAEQFDMLEKKVVSTFPSMLAQGGAFNTGK